MTEAKSNDERFPEVKPTKPGNDTAYIAPIIGKLGYDTRRPWLFGLGTSPNNGVDFHVFLSFDGLSFDESDVDKLFQVGASDRVKKMVDSATAEIPQAVSNANEAVKRADSAVANSKVNSDAIKAMQSAVSAAKSDANVALQSAVADFNKEKSANQSAYAALHSSVASNQADIDSISKSLDGLSTNLKQYAQDAASQGKTIAELKQNQSDISATVASVEGNVNQLKVDTKNIQATASDNKSDIANLQISASSASVAIKDANSNVALAVATASQASVELQDAKRNIATVQATAEDLQGTVANAQSDINQVKADAKGIHEQITNANSQIATINTSVNDLQTSVSQVTSSVNDISKTAQANKTAIDQNTKAIALKANQTSVDDLNKTVSSQTASLTVMNNAINTKVTSADVEKAIDGKGYVTKDFVESSLTQSAKSLSESIASVDGKVQNITADLTGLQSTVKDKADQSTVTQLANTYQVKLTGNLLASLGKKAQKYTVGNNTFFPFASIDVTKVTKGTVLTLSFDYSSDADCAFVPQLDGTPWIPWGDIKDNPISVKANVPGHYVKQITVGDDSWTKGTAKNIAIRIDNFGGTFTVSNLTLRSGDNVASTFDMLQYDMDLRVQKGDLISQLNMEAGQTLIQSKKLSLDADSVVFSGKAFIPDAAIENLSLDKLTTGSLKVPLADDNGNAISLDESGITINSALSPVTWIPFYGKSDDQSSFYLSLSSKGMKFVNHFVYGKDTQKQIGAKSDDYTFMDIQPDVLHYRDGSTDNVNIPSGLTMYIPQETSSSLGPASPGGFFAMGYKNFGSALHGQDIKKGVEIAYVNKEINGWLEGFHVETNMFVHPRGADHGIRFAWVSWSAWDFGERYPAIVNDTTNWGGVAFPKSGSVTLFNATGKYYTPDKDTGHGTYSDYQ